MKKYVSLLLTAAMLLAMAANLFACSFEMRDPMNPTSKPNREDEVSKENHYVENVRPAPQDSEKAPDHSTPAAPPIEEPDPEPDMPEETKPSDGVIDPDEFESETEPGPWYYTVSYQVEGYYQHIPEDKVSSDWEWAPTGDIDIDPLLGTFDGWYVDSHYMKPFDPYAHDKKDITLYGRVIPAPNAPALFLDASYIQKCLIEGPTYDLNFSGIETWGNREYIRLLPAGVDPWFMFLNSEEGYDLPLYMVISYRATSSLDGEFFMGEGAGPNGADHFIVDWKEDGQWRQMVINLKKYMPNEFSSGRLNYARMDVFAGMVEEGEYMDIEYIAFFDSPQKAREFDKEKHKAPMWDEAKDVVLFHSFDELSTYTNGGQSESVFAPGQSSSWDRMLVCDTTVSSLRYWGWAAVMGSFGQFGYQIDDKTAVYSDSFTISPEQGLIDAVAGMGCDAVNRMDIRIPLDGLTGTHTVRAMYRTLEGVEVCLGTFTVERNLSVYSVPQDTWAITGHNTAINDSSNPMVAAAGVASAALLHQGSIYLGELDLSQYSKVVIYWGCDNSQVTLDHYAANPNNRIMLLDTVMDMTMSPDESTIIAGGTYQLMGWAVTAFEIDLSNITYKGPVYVAVDTLPGTFALISEVEFYGYEKAPATVMPSSFTLSLHQSILGQDLYFTGVMNGNYLATSPNAGEAVTMYNEAYADGYRMYFLNSDQKYYVEIYDRGSGKAGVRITDVPTTHFVWNAEANTWATFLKDAGAYFYLGTYGKYETISASNIAYIIGENAANVGSSQYVLAWNPFY